MQEDISDIEFWPGEGPASGTRLVMGTASFLQGLPQNFFGLFSRSCEWHQLQGGGERRKCDESVNNQGKRERKCEVAL